MNWDDLRYFRAVAETGSLSGAAKTTGSSQPTVGRRVAALEDALGVRLFRRHGRGYALTEEGERLLDPVSEIERLAWKVQRRAQGEQRPVSGHLRVSVPDGLAVEWLVPRLAGFREAFPKITLSVTTESTVAQVERTAADIALRLFRPTSPPLVARRVATFANGLFAGRAYLAKRGLPRKIDDLRRHDWVTFDQDLARLPEATWLTSRTTKAPSVRSNNLLAQRAAVVAGLGVGVLPLYLGRKVDALERVLPRTALPKRAVWLVVHEDLRSAGRVRAFLDFVAEAFRESHTEFV